MHLTIVNPEYLEWEALTNRLLDAAIAEADKRIPDDACRRADGTIDGAKLIDELFRRGLHRP